tara:strand:+ start:5380 stop:5586 length:207 start_codon:yes stop_codon:yes gene_type:complete
MIRGFFCFKKTVCKTAAAFTEKESGQPKEELLKLCLTSHLLEELGSSGFSEFLRSNNLIQIKPDTTFN